MKLKSIARMVAGLSFGVLGTLAAQAVGVGTAAEFKSALATADSIRLSADLDLADWTPVDYVGTIDGDGHTVTGLNGPMFVTLSGSVGNLTIDGSTGSGNTTINLDLSDNGSFGLLALTTTAARVENLNVKGYSLADNQPQSKTRKNGVGLLVGMACDGCAFIGDVTMEGCTLTAGSDIAAGGLVGNISCSESYAGETGAAFSNCINNAKLYTSGASSGAGFGTFGGILGRDLLTGVQTRPLTIEFSDCVNNGDWNATGSSGNWCVGGMIGCYAFSTGAVAYNTLKMTGCANHGDMSAPANVSCNNMRLGGLVGMAGRYVDNIECDRCLNDGDVTILSTGVSGGLLAGWCAYMYDISKNARITVRNFVNRGNLYIPSSDTKSNKAAGLLGYASQNVNYYNYFTVGNCSFLGTLTAKVTSPLVAQYGSSTSISGSSTFTIDNCFFLSEGTLVDTASSFASGKYSETNVKFHAEGEDASECTALSLVASANEKYAAWQVSEKSGHPEPVLGATLYTVIFNDYDGTLISMQQVAEGEAAAAPANPTRAGYTFAGWEPSDFTAIASNVTIVATYEQNANSRTVTFLDYDGRVLGELSVDAGTSVGDRAPQPERTGYTFAGWTLNEAAYDLATAVTENLSLVASYAINVYDVAFFDWNGARLGETQKVEYLSAAIAPELPELPEGKAFWKWSCDFSSVASDLEVRASICDGEQTIATAADFAAKINAESPSVVIYSLTDDLALDGWTSVDFAGTLEGNGHVIRGLTAPLFGSVGGTVRNLAVDGALAAESEEGTTATNTVLLASGNTGILAKTLAGGRIENCRVRGFTITTSKSASDEYVGLAVGAAVDGAVIDAVTVEEGCLLQPAVGTKTGGIVGWVSSASAYEGPEGCLVLNCTNGSDIVRLTGDNNDRGGVGGIVGMVEGYGAVEHVVSNCVNTGMQTVTSLGAHHGGIVGLGYVYRNPGLVIVDCENRGDIIATTTGQTTQYKNMKLGGILATSGSLNIGGAVRIERCVNRGRLDAGEASFEDGTELTEVLTKRTAGGIAGDISVNRYVKPTIVSCANYGEVSAYHVGGIVARQNGTSTDIELVIRNCANYGKLTLREAPDSYIGQAVGRVTDSKSMAVSIDGCLFSGSDTVGQTDDTVTVTVGDTVFDSTADGFNSGLAVRALSDWSAERGYASWVRGRIGPELELFGTPYSSPMIIRVR